MFHNLIWIVDVVKFDGCWMLFSCGISFRAFGVCQVESKEFCLWWSLSGLLVLRLFSDV